MTNIIKTALWLVLAISAFGMGAIVASKNAEKIDKEIASYHETEFGTGIDQYYGCSDQMLAVLINNHDLFDSELEQICKSCGYTNLHSACVDLCDKDLLVYHPSFQYQGCCYTEGYNTPSAIASVAWQQYNEERNEK